MLTIVLLAIVIALLFDFLNGMNDAANSIATIVATRVFSPTMAVCWAAFWNFAAIFIFGVSVAHTMGEGIVDPSRINEYLILAALIGSVIWVWLCTHFGMPISVSHALIGGLIGPVWFTFGGDAGCFRDIQNCHLYRAVPFDRYDIGILHDVSHNACVS